MAKNYSITFVSLRSATVYTLNIGGGAGAAVPLMGGAQPFITQEDETDDQYRPIRTQSGYLRVLDTGKDANGNAWDWKDLIPDSDTARPVTLTHVSNGTTIVDWVGFMQAQDFGSVLYGNPQEREIPVQCVLTVTQGTDINYDQKALQNFAYLLKQIIDAIPSDQRPANYVIQGGAEAQAWLLKKIDWQNFCTTDDEGNLSARFTMYECLEDLCRFWGWTARTHRQTMYLTCSDDQIEPKLLKLTYADLATMAGGTAAGTTTDEYQTVALSGDIFASFDNNDFLVRGVNNSQVQANGNRADSYLVDTTTESLRKLLSQQGWDYEHPVVIDDNVIYYTNDLSSFTFQLLKGSSRTNYGSFNLGENTIENARAAGSGDYIPMFKIKKSADSSVTDPYVSFETVYQHAFNDGYLFLLGTTYQGIKYEDVTDRQKSIGDYKGNKSMYMRLGVGATRETAKWYNGTTWVSEVATFKATLGNADEYLRTKSNSGNFTRKWIPITENAGLAGYVYIDFLGSDDMPERSGERSFEIGEFKMIFSRDMDVDRTPGNNNNNVRYYKAKNQNKVRGDYDVDCIYASDNNMGFGYGILINPDGTYMTGLLYGESTVPVYPEQHLADRVVAYWSQPKRKLSCELKANAIEEITPGNFVTIDGTLTHPISINRDWHDDVIKFVLLEMPETEE